MRPCVVLPCFFPEMRFEDAVKTIARLGYDACEIYNWRNLDFESAVCALSEAGVELLSMCTTEFCLTDASRSQIYLSALEESCAAARRLGARRLITQVGADTGEAREKQTGAIISTLQKAKSILEGYEVTLMIEPLNTLYDHRGYFLSSSKEAFEIVRVADSPFVKVVFDIYHQQVSEGNVINNILDHLDLISHLHAAGNPGRIEMQLGENDYRVIFGCIDRAGFRGACGLEYRPTLGAEESLKKAKEIYFS